MFLMLSVRGIATSTFDLSTPVWKFHTGVEESKVEVHGVESAIWVFKKYKGGREIMGNVP